jgi:hypothetical protein
MGPDKFEEFKRYTLNNKKRCISRKDARGTVLVALLQKLRDPNARGLYEEHKDRARRAAREGENDDALGIRDSDGNRRLASSSGLGRGARLERQRQQQQQRERGLSIVKEEQEPEEEVKEEPRPSLSLIQNEPRGRPASWGDSCEVISIHDSESEYSWPSTPAPPYHGIKRRRSSSPIPVVELPLSPTEIPSSGQQGVKRCFKEKQDDDEPAISRSTAKRPRVWKDGRRPFSVLNR